MVARTEADIVYYALGTGDYTELARALLGRDLAHRPCTAILFRSVRRSAVAEALRHLAAALREAMRKPPTEALLLDHYARLCLVVDEVVHEVRRCEVACTSRAGRFSSPKSARALMGLFNVQTCTSDIMHGLMHGLRMVWRGRRDCWMLQTRTPSCGASS